MDAKTSPLQESPGVESAKRWAGAVLLAAGLSILLPLAWVSIFGANKAPDPATALACAQTLIYSGTATLVGTVLEGLGKKLGGA